MSLSALINNAAQAAFDAIGDLKESGIATATGSPVYDPATGQYTTTNVEDSISFVKYEFERGEVNGDSVRHGDSKFLARVGQLSVDARTYAYITHNSQKWDVVSADSVPGDSVVIFHVRLQNG